MPMRRLTPYRCDVTPMSIRSLKSLRGLACPSNGQGHPLPIRAIPFLTGLPLWGSLLPEAHGADQRVGKPSARASRCPRTGRLLQRMGKPLSQGSGDTAGYGAAQYDTAYCKRLCQDTARYGAAQRMRNPCRPMRPLPYSLGRTINLIY